MRTRRLVARLTIAATIGLAAIVACGDEPAGPGPIGGRYTLRLIGTQPVPVLVLETRTTEQAGGGSLLVLDYVDGATLVLLDPEPDTLLLARRTIVAPEGGTPEATAWVEQLPIRLDGDRRCVDDAFSHGDLACDGPRVGRRGDSLFIDLAPLPFSVARRHVFVREGR